MKLKLIILTIFNLLAISYLLSPTPTLPDLPNSVKSNLPGDTVQLKNVSAYYSNLSRTEVMNFYRANYTGPFRIILNHPPERARDIIRDTTQSYYLEEIVLPFKESLFINGYEWQNDVFTKPEKRQTNKLIYQDIEYQTKITLKTFPTSIPRRLITLFIVQLSLLIICRLYLNLIKKRRD